MTYELAKKLKDAGFSQEPKPNGFGMLVGKTKIDGGDGIDDPVWFPSLSELIEACRDKFQDLYRDYSDNSWRARDRRDKQEFGSTPEEAVANLWLKLNESRK